MVCMVIERASDQWKLAHVLRRPQPKRVADIGAWEGIIWGVVLLSVLTNSVLVALTSEQLAACVSS